MRKSEADLSLDGGGHMFPLAMIGARLNKMLSQLHPSSLSASLFCFSSTFLPLSLSALPSTANTCMIG